MSACAGMHSNVPARYCFILGLIWNTTNRAILDVPEHTRLPARHEEDRRPPDRGSSGVCGGTSADGVVAASSQEENDDISSQPAAAVGAPPGPAPPPPTPSPGLGPLLPGQQNTNQETHPGDVAEPWGRRRWRWHAVCRSCGKVEDSEWVFGGAPQRPVGWPKKLDMCPFCWAKSGNKMKLR